MKTLLTGASGMLAAEVVPTLLQNGHEVIQTDLRPRLPDIQSLDILNYQNIQAMIKNVCPDYVFHLAAETNVDLCQQQPDHAFRTNTFGTENLALCCQEKDIPMLYISTGGVFYGDKLHPYTEFDVPRPINVYGESKWQGEIVVRRLLRRYFIVRAGWMVGGWEIDKKFVYKIVQQLKEGRSELSVVADKFGSPTFTKDFAKNLLPLLKTGRYGLYHMANKGTCSRYDMAVKIVEFMGLKNKVKVIPINSAQFPLPAARADSEMIQNYKLELLGLNNMPRWEDSLKEYIMTNKGSHTIASSKI